MSAPAPQMPLFQSPYVIERAFRNAAAYHRSGRLDEANALYRAVIERDPKHLGAHHMLAVLATQTGHLEAARQFYERALRLSPEDTDLRLGLAEAYRALGRFDEAETAAAAVLESEPDNAHASHVLGLIRRDRGEVKEAVEVLRASVAEAPTHSDALSALARLCDRLGEAGEAAELRRRAETAAHFMEGRELLDYGKAAAAEPLIVRALEGLDDVAQVHLAAGQCAQALGRFEDAEMHLVRAMEIDPRQGGPYVAWARSHRFEDGDPLVARMEALRDDPAVGERAQHGLSFALGKAYDDLGRHDDAFGMFARGNAIQARRAPFDPKAHASEIGALIDTFTAAFFAERRGWGDPSRQPVLVVGMPRSGTTLVEQIVASHPRAAGAGELSDLRHISQAMPVDPGRLLVYPRNVGLLRRDGAKAMAKAYLDALREGAGTARAERIVDKMPDNFLFLGYAAMLLPRARVIHCTRDPRDVGLSCFTTNFHDELAFSTDLAAIGAYWREYRRLMAHWAEVLPLDVLDVSYEELVSDVAGGARRILDFLGLPWDDAVLDFHRTERPVSTASVWQVRQPASTRSVGRWKRYEAHLGPLIEALGDAA